VDSNSVCFRYCFKSDSFAGQTTNTCNRRAAAVDLKLLCCQLVVCKMVILNLADTEQCGFCIRMVLYDHFTYYFSYEYATIQADVTWHISQWKDCLLPIACWLPANNHWKPISTYWCMVNDSRWLKSDIDWLTSTTRLMHVRPHTVTHTFTLHYITHPPTCQYHWLYVCLSMSRDCTPGLVFPIPQFTVADFAIPGSHWDYGTKNMGFTKSDVYVMTSRSNAYHTVKCLSLEHLC